MNKKICVVGAGFWGRNHIKTLNKISALSGIVDLDDNLLNTFKKVYSGTRIHKDINEAIAEDYDGFVIATPAKTHYKIAKLIIESGKPVLIEKPMALSLKEADVLVELAEKYNVNVLVGHVLLFHPAILKIENMIQKGLVGNLQYIYSNRLNLGKVRTEENVFWSFAPHDIAIFQYLIKSSPKKINATGSTFLQEGIPDSTLTTLEYKNGIKGHIFVSWLHPFKEHRLVVIGSEAMISFEDSVNGKPLKLYSKKIDIISGLPEQIDGPVENINYENKMPLEQELKYFLKHLEKEKPKVSNIYHGREVVKILTEATSQILT